MEAEKRIRYRSRRVRTGAFFARGGRRMTSLLTGSTPKDCDGGPEDSTLVSKGLIADGRSATHHP